MLANFTVVACELIGLVVWYKASRSLCLSAVWVGGCGRVGILYFVSLYRNHIIEMALTCIPKINVKFPLFVMCSIPSVHSKLYGMFSCFVLLTFDCGIAVRYKGEILRGLGVEVSRRGESHSMMSSNPTLPTKVSEDYLDK